MRLINEDDGYQFGLTQAPIRGRMPLFRNERTRSRRGCSISSVRLVLALLNHISFLDHYLQHQPPQWTLHPRASQPAPRARPVRFLFSHTVKKKLDNTLNFAVLGFNFSSPSVQNQIHELAKTLPPPRRQNTACDACRCGLSVRPTPN